MCMGIHFRKFNIIVCLHGCQTPYRNPFFGFRDSRHCGLGSRKPHATYYVTPHNEVLSTCPAHKYLRQPFLWVMGGWQVARCPSGDRQGEGLSCHQQVSRSPIVVRTAIPATHLPEMQADSFGGKNTTWVYGEAFVTPDLFQPVAL